MCTGSVLRQRVSHQRVAALVVGGDLLLLVVHQPGALLRAGDDAVDRLVHARSGRSACSPCARGEQRGLVEDVGEVGAGEAGGAARDGEQVDVRRDRLALGVHRRGSRAGR